MMQRLKAHVRRLRCVLVDKYYAARERRAVRRQHRRNAESEDGYNYGNRLLKCGVTEDTVFDLSQTTGTEAFGCGMQRAIADWDMHMARGASRVGIMKTDIMFGGPNDA